MISYNTALMSIVIPPQEVYASLYCRVHRTYYCPHCILCTLQHGLNYLYQLVYIKFQPRIVLCK